MKSDKSNLTIRYADGRDTDALYKLWKECFHDTDAFMAYYFDYYLRDNRILILEQKNQLKSMIHLNPYTLSVCGKKVKIQQMILAFPDERFNTNSKNTTFYRFVSGSPNGEPFFGILFACIYKQIQIFYF